MANENLTKAKNDEFYPPYYNIEIEKEVLSGRNYKEWSDHAKTLKEKNNLKIKLVEQNFKNDSLKKKLLGLN